MPTRLSFERRCCSLDLGGLLLFLDPGGYLRRVELDVFKMYYRHSLFTLKLALMSRDNTLVPPYCFASSNSYVVRTTISASRQSQAFPMEVCDAICCLCMVRVIWMIHTVSAGTYVNFSITIVDYIISFVTLTSSSNVEVHGSRNLFFFCWRGNWFYDGF